MGDSNIFTTKLLFSNKGGRFMNNDYLSNGVKANLFQVLDKLTALTDLLKNFNPETDRLPKKIDVLIEDITLEIGVVLSEIE